MSTENKPSHQPQDIMRWFTYAHLPADKQDVSRRFAELAEFVNALPAGAEKATALRKLLEGKDAAVRASFDR